MPLRGCRVTNLHGFKTFAGKTHFHFSDGITAVVGPNGSGKCVTGDTLVTLTDGRDVAIRDLVDEALQNAQMVETLDDGFVTRENPRAIQILSINPATLGLEARSVAGFVKRQAPPTLLHIRTRSGRSVTVTPYHPLFTLENGQLRALQAEELVVGVRLAVPRKLPVGSGGEKGFTPFDILQLFAEADCVYVPSSESLRRWGKETRASFGRQQKWQEAAGVRAIQLKSFLDGQSVNAAVLVSLSKAANSLPPLEGNLKSHGHGQIKLPTILSLELARFLGLMIAEGQNDGTANQVRFVNSDPAINHEFERLVKTLFDVSVYPWHYEAGTVASIIFSRTLGMVLDRLFNFRIGSNSSQKEIPPQLLQTSPEIQWAFLSGLFEGDTYFCRHQKTGARKKAQAYIEYVSASPKLAHQVAALLLRLGVFPLVRMKMKYASNTLKKTRRPYYSVLIYGAQAVRYVAHHLSFIGQKQEDLEVLRNWPTASNPNLDLVPGVTGLVKKAVRLASVKIKPNRKRCPKLSAYVIGNKLRNFREGQERPNWTEAGQTIR